MKSDIRHILYADDDRDDIELFEEAVSTLSHMSINSVTDGKALLNSLNELPVPGLIVLDLYMPLYDGESCIKAIRCLSRFDKVPVLIYSADMNEGAISRCRLWGADYFANKPANFAEILRMVYDITLGKYDSANHHSEYELMQECA